MEKDELEAQVDDLRKMVMADGKQPGSFKRPKPAETGTSTSTPKAEDVSMGYCPNAEATAAVAAAITLSKLQQLSQEQKSNLFFGVASPEANTAQ